MPPLVKGIASWSALPFCCFAVLVAADSCPAADAAGTTPATIQPSIGTTARGCPSKALIQLSRWPWQAGGITEDAADDAARPAVDVAREGPDSSGSGMAPDEEDLAGFMPAEEIFRGDSGARAGTAEGRLQAPPMTSKTEQPMEVTSPESAAAAESPGWEVPEVSSREAAAPEAEEAELPGTVRRPASEADQSDLSSAARLPAGEAPNVPRDVAPSDADGPEMSSTARSRSREMPGASPDIELSEPDQTEASSAARRPARRVLDTPPEVARSEADQQEQEQDMRPVEEVFPQAASESASMVPHTNARVDVAPPARGRPAMNVSEDAMQDAVQQSEVGTRSVTVEDGADVQSSDNVVPMTQEGLIPMKVPIHVVPGEDELASKNLRANVKKLTHHRVQVGRQKQRTVLHSAARTGNRSLPAHARMPKRSREQKLSQAAPPEQKRSHAVSREREHAMEKAAAEVASLEQKFSRAMSREQKLSHATKDAAAEEAASIEQRLLHSLAQEAAEEALDSAVKMLSMPAKADNDTTANTSDAQVPINTTEAPPEAVQANMTMQASTTGMPTFGQDPDPCAGGCPELKAMMKGYVEAYDYNQSAKLQALETKMNKKIEAIKKNRNSRAEAVVKYEGPPVQPAVAPAVSAPADAGDGKASMNVPVTVPVNVQSPPSAPAAASTTPCPTTEAATTPRPGKSGKATNVPDAPAVVYMPNPAPTAPQQVVYAGPQQVYAPPTANNQVIYAAPQQVYAPQPGVPQAAGYAAAPPVVMSPCGSFAMTGAELGAEVLSAPLHPAFAAQSALQPPPLPPQPLLQQQALLQPQLQSVYQPLQQQAPLAVQGPPVALLAETAGQQPYATAAMLASSGFSPMQAVQQPFANAGVAAAPGLSPGQVAYVY